MVKFVKADAPARRYDYRKANDVVGIFPLMLQHMLARIYLLQIEIWLCGQIRLSISIWRNPKRCPEVNSHVILCRCRVVYASSPCSFQAKLLHNDS